jgi:hypothetical protein
LKTVTLVKARVDELQGNRVKKFVTRG